MTAVDVGSSIAAGPARPVDRITSSAPKQRADPRVDRGDSVFAPGDWASTDPFLTLAEDWFSNVGFTWHPHRGFETVTLALSGELEHGDSAGHSGVLQAGDVQWMTAGSGIVHKELALGGQPVHTLQLWVNLPAALKGVEPAYQDLRRDQVPVVTTAGSTVAIFAGSHAGRTAPARTLLPVTMLDIELAAGAELEIEVPPAHRAFGYVLTGRVSATGREVRAGQVFWLDPSEGDASRLELVGTEPARVILLHGQPIGEPVVAGYRRQGGSFVMNTLDEIHQAFEDFGAGRFGTVPQADPVTR